MRIYEVPSVLTEAVREQRRQEEARTGLHCSTIVNDILHTMDPARYGREFEEHERFGYQEFGNVLEDIVAAGLARRHASWQKPEPRVFRGIWGSPDGFCRSPMRTIDEIKAAWMSERDFLTIGPDHEAEDESLKFLGYCMQALFYALAWDATRIRLHVFFVNGAYPKGKPAPHPRTFVLRPTERDKEANYERLRQHAIDARLDGWKGLRAA